MRRVAELIGWLFIWGWLMASFDFFDLHICLKPAGECRKQFAHVEK